MQMKYMCEWAFESQTLSLPSQIMNISPHVLIFVFESFGMKHFVSLYLLPFSLQRLKTMTS